MEHGPLPPHERTWRHPSELAAEERNLLRAQTAPVSARLLALATGAVGLAVVGALVMSVTPRRYDAPIAISATTTPASVPGDAGASSDPVPAGSTALAIRRTVDVTTDALATPIGTGRFAFVTRSAAGDTPERPFGVRLPSGRLSTGWMINEISDAIIVELDDGEPGHPIARRRPEAHEIVTVMQTPPVTIAYADIDTLEIGEGVAIIDDEGALVGICSSDGHTTRVIEITDDSIDGDSAGNDEAEPEQVIDETVVATTVAP